MFSKTKKELTHLLRFTFSQHTQNFPKQKPQRKANENKKTTQKQLASCKISA